MLFWEGSQIFIPENASESAYLLERTAEGLQLVSAHQQHGAIRCDFSSGTFAHRLKYGGKYVQPLAKAIGLKKGIQLSVFDATAGFGSDAMLLAAWGCKVSMVERNPLVFAVLQDGIERARQAVEFENCEITYECIDSRHFLEKTVTPFDVIYLDPMFELEKRGAKSGKNMQALQTMLSSDENNFYELFSLAQRHALRRVVVKRAKSSEYIVSTPPSFTIDGKANRFDVYLTV